MSPTPSPPPRPAVASPTDGRSTSPTDGRSSTACFAVHAACEPSVMPRVLGVFAKRGLVPLQWHSIICPAPEVRRQDLHIDVQISGIEQAAAARLAEDLRKVVGVIAVLTSRKQYALTA